MALKGETSPEPVRKPRQAAKPPKQQRTAPVDFDPSYGDNYGSTAGPLERRQPGRQPNNRPLSAVERAEQRVAMNSPAAIRQRKKPQMPGMDMSYHADEEMERLRTQSRQDFIDKGYEGDTEGAEVIETAEQRQESARLARMGPVGRADPRRSARMGSYGASPRRNQYGRIQVLNRSGKLISRTHYATADKFDVPPSFIPDGWTYQWISQSTIGKSNNNTHFFANGWEAVPPSRHDGVFTQKGYEGSSIIVDDMVLVERPVELTLEARAEELLAAKNLIRTRNEQFQPRLPGARSRRYPGTELMITREYEEAPDDLKPRYIIDDGSYEHMA